MKKHIPIIILLFFVGSGSIAQTFSDDNFIYTARPKKAVQAANYNTLTKSEITQSVMYFDGLGRPIQSIAIGQGRNDSDIVTHMEYDGFGRQVKEYLPYSSSNGSNNYFRIDPINALNTLISFYGTQKYTKTLQTLFLKKCLNRPHSTEC
jgi:hypothetical protein